MSSASGVLTRMSCQLALGYLQNAKSPCVVKVLRNGATKKLITYANWRLNTDTRTWERMGLSYRYHGTKANPLACAGCNVSACQAVVNQSRKNKR